MSEPQYTKLEVDLQFKEVHQRFDNQDKTLVQILDQTTDHNHRMTKIERVLLIVGTAVIVLLITQGSRFVQFAMAIVK